MNCVGVATLIVSCIGVGVAIWGICLSKKSSKELSNQNKQDKIDWIQSELYNIDEELRKQNMRYQLTGTEKRKRDQAVDSLKKRKDELENQLKQLQNEVV